MRNKIAERDRVEPFGGVIKPGVVDVIDGCELIARDDGHDKIRVPRFAFSEVRGSSRFVCGGGSGWIDWVVRVW